MAAKRLKKGQDPMDLVAKIEDELKRQRTKLLRTINTMARLETRRAYYVRKAVEKGVS